MTFSFDIIWKIKIFSLKKEPVVYNKGQEMMKDEMISTNRKFTKISYFFTYFTSCYLKQEKGRIILCTENDFQFGINRRHIYN